MTNKRTQAIAFSHLTALTVVLGYYAKGASSTRMSDLVGSEIVTTAFIWGARGAVVLVPFS